MWCSFLGMLFLCVFVCFCRLSFWHLFKFSVVNVNFIVARNGDNYLEVFLKESV